MEEKKPGQVRGLFIILGAGLAIAGAVTIIYAITGKAEIKELAYMGMTAVAGLLGVAGAYLKGVKNGKWRH